MIPVKQLYNNISSDKDLLSTFVENDDQEALAILYMRYTELVYGTCLKYLKNTEAAKDAVMNIYYELTYKLKNHQVDNFRAWVYTLVKNHCLMQLRKKKQAIMVEIQPAFMHSEDFLHLEKVLENERAYKKLSGCMEKLPEGQQKAVSLFYFENKCYNEIAGIIGCESSKIRSFIQNGKRNLKICMEENGRT